MKVSRLLPRIVKILLKRLIHKYKQPSTVFYSGAEAGLNCLFEEGVTLYDGVKVNNSQIGKYTYIASGTKVTNTKIGRFCSIGSEVICGPGMHPTKQFVSTHPSFYSTFDQSQIKFVDTNHFIETQTIVIGNDVWIGSRAIILDGITIGDGAIIGAGAIVSRDIPDYSIAVGVPARIIKYRFSSDYINFLKKTRWWEWEISYIQSNSMSFLDIEEFYKRFSVRSGDNENE